MNLSDRYTKRDPPFHVSAAVPSPVVAGPLTHVTNTSRQANFCLPKEKKNFNLYSQDLKCFPYNHICTWVAINLVWQSNFFLFVSLYFMRDIHWREEIPNNNLTGFDMQIPLLMYKEIIIINSSPLLDYLFVNSPGDRGSIPGRIMPKTFKMVLDTSLLHTQHYKVCIKGKVEQFRERSSALPNTSV